MNYAAHSRFLIFSMVMAGCSSAPPAKPSINEIRSVQPVAVPAAEMAQPAEEGRVIAAVDDENSLFFPRGMAEIDLAGRQKLRLHAERLKSNSKLRVTLIGSTDEQGSRSFNLAIAENRVNAVYQQLRDFGVAKGQLRRSSVGGEMNSKSCRSEACRKLMRRVELHYKH
jgi:outer membrane protein OmpA-like peptidoglycan-associated protein